MATKKAIREKTLYCSFCGKDQHKVKKLIAGPSVFVCGRMLELCKTDSATRWAGRHRGAATPRPSCPRRPTSRAPGQLALIARSRQAHAGVAVYTHKLPAQRQGQEDDVELAKASIC